MESSLIISLSTTLATLQKKVQKLFVLISSELLVVLLFAKHCAYYPLHFVIPFKTLFSFFFSTFFHN